MGEKPTKRADFKIEDPRTRVDPYTGTPLAEAAISADSSLIVGEASRSIDDRHRLSLPADMVAGLGGDNCECLLAKERPGCLSLWSRDRWQQKLDEEVGLVRSKISAGRLDGRIAEVQSLGRLLSTRQRPVQLAARGRLVVPEGFREFLGVEPGNAVMIVGAAVCIEIWKPETWADCIGQQMPEFRQLLDELAG
ncbi:MAG: division/cell wall cluster transcriptional repressor MraZ [Planctomycetota bacterium]